MKKILVINVNWLGDVIFSSPVFKAIKAKYPQASVTCLGPLRVKEILEANQFIDNIILFDDKGKERSLLAKLMLVLRLRREKFDLAIILHRSMTRALFCFLAGIKVRVGYDTKNRRRLLTCPIKEPKEDLHRSDYYLNLIEKFGINVDDRRAFLSVKEEAADKAGKILKNSGVDEGDYKVVINPGGNWGLKRWPKENFTSLIRKLNFDGDKKIIISGSDKDADLANEIVHSLNFMPIILCGKLKTEELIAFLSKVDCVVSGDSGPLHIANALGTATVGIFGPTSRKITSPRGVGRSVILQEDIGCNREPCYFLECPRNLCMEAVTAEEVYQAVNMIKKGA
ncbi:MAG: lipopolysaccharide heptosyltransferase II [Candidatus Omnitrophica bacterium]|nr:lipopolysaccharide heptosyltransferase II [Candidatus Omnitrophota bacterium]